MKSFSLIIFFCYLINIAQAQENKSYKDYISWYQNNLSDLRNGNCQMYPSCSTYGQIAFNNYHPLVAMIKISDRVLRCSHDHKFYNKRWIDNKYKIIDYPIKNDTLDNILFSMRSKTAFPYEVSSKKNEYSFIQQLMCDRNYKMAALELKRLIFFKGDTLAVGVYIDAMKCNRVLNLHEESIYDYENFYPQKIKKNKDLKKELALSYYEIGSVNKALQILSDSTNSTMLLKGLIYSSQYNFNEAATSFKKVNKNSPLAYSSKKALAILEGAKDFKHKSPLIAGCCSIVPGGGYLYTGHKSSALSSFIVNGLLGYAFFSTLNQENYGLASLIGVFNFSFYVGNVSGSVKSAKRYNLSHKETTFKKLKSIINY